MFDRNKIAELYPEAEDMMIEPMLIKKPKDDNELKAACNSGKWFGQIKKDGAFYQFVKTTNHSYLFGRTVSKETNLLTEKSDRVPHIVEQLAELPANSILIGEIYYPGKSSKDTVSIMGALAPKAIERQKGNYGYIHYYVHDILMYDGVSLHSTDNYTRYKILQKVFEKHNLANEFVELAKIYEEDLYAEVGNALAAGEEGMVIKLKEGLYQPGKRPTSNLKAKKVDFADVVIMGFEEPTIEYYGKELENWQYWVNPEVIEGHEWEEEALEKARFPVGLYYDKYTADNSECQFYLPVTKAYYMGWWNSRIKIGAWTGEEENKIMEIGTIHSGISDEMKKQMSENPQDFVGKVCAIQMMEVDSKEKTIRHGFFKGMRLDKPSKNCQLDEIFDK